MSPKSPACHTEVSRANLRGSRPGSSPIIEPAQMPIADLGDPPRQDLARGVAKRRCASFGISSSNSAVPTSSQFKPPCSGPVVAELPAIGQQLPLQGRPNARRLIRGHAFKSATPDIARGPTISMVAVRLACMSILHSSGTNASQPGNGFPRVLRQDRDGQSRGVIQVVRATRR
jgi:hypothetical protein